MSPERYPYNIDSPVGDLYRTPKYSLCWRCDFEILFEQPKCDKCGATNPNWDLETATAEMKAMHDDD